MKSGNLNFLEPSGPLQACNGTDLTFTLTVLYLSIFPEHADTFFTSWQKFKNSVLLDRRLVQLQRFISGHYHVLTVVVYGKVGQVRHCALGIVLKNSVMSVENLVFMTQGVLNTEHRL